MTTTKILSYAAARTAMRSETYDRAGRHEEAEAYFTASQRMHQLANERAGLRLVERVAPAVASDPLAERCRRCRYRLDEHDFDGKCPLSEDDAAYYREQ